MSDIAWMGAKFIHAMRHEPALWAICRRLFRAPFLVLRLQLIPGPFRRFRFLDSAEAMARARMTSNAHECHKKLKKMVLKPIRREEVVMTSTFDPAIGTGTRWAIGRNGNPGGRPKSRLLSQALSSRLAEIKPDDPEGRTYAEVVAANLVEIAFSRGPGAKITNELLSLLAP